MKILPTKAELRARKSQARQRQRALGNAPSDAPEHRRERERKWRARNRAKHLNTLREQYQIHKAERKFLALLNYRLNRVREAEIKRGRVPYDG